MKQKQAINTIFWAHLKGGFDEKAKFRVKAAKKKIAGGEKTGPKEPESPKS